VLNPDQPWFFYLFFWLYPFAAFAQPGGGPSDLFLFACIYVVPCDEKVGETAYGINRNNTPGHANNYGISKKVIYSSDRLLS